MWRLLFCSANCRIGALLLIAGTFSGCDWDASSGKSVRSSEPGGNAATEPDTTPPAVRATNPEDGSEGVSRAAAITAEFNEDIFASTVDGDSFTIVRVDDTSRTLGSVSFDADSNTASFSPDIPLDMLETYAANLSTDITDLGGNALAEQHAWSFTAGDGEWQTAGLIETSNSGSARAAQIALDADGRGLAVWEQFQGSRYKIWANRFDGSAWGDPALIESNTGGAASGPQLALNAAGQGVAVWQQDNGSVKNIWANRFNEGAWGGAELVQTELASDARDPQIAMTPDGKALAVWSQFEAACHRVWARYFNGSDWGMAVSMRPDDDDVVNACDTSPPQVAMAEDGQALAVWAERDGALTTIWANRFNGSSWGSPRQIQANINSDARTPRIAMSSEGEALAVWAESDGFRYNIWANRFADGAWGTAEQIENEEAGTAENPQLAIDAEGLAFAVWQYDGGVNDVVFNRFDGESWGEAGRIESDSTTDVRNPQVAIDTKGRALAVWEQFSGGQYCVWANRFAGSAWGVAEQIEGESGNAASAPQIAFDDTGNAVAVWHKFDGARNNIWANRFE